MCQSKNSTVSHRVAEHELFTIAVFTKNRGRPGLFAVVVITKKAWPVEAKRRSCCEEPRKDGPKKLKNEKQQSAWF
jgi:hypothetical protein